MVAQPANPDEAGKQGASARRCYLTGATTGGTLP